MKKTLILSRNHKPKRTDQKDLKLVRDTMVIVSPQRNIHGEKHNLSLLQKLWKKITGVSNV